MDIAKGNIGSEVNYDLKFEDLKLQFKIERKGALGDSEGFYGTLPGDAVVAALFDGLEKVIPGDQKMAFEMAKQFVVGMLPK
jgi:hypothetical protein